MSNQLVAEDWTRIYQAFKGADFQSYDADTLRRSMVQYLKTNYPENFNDYISSSEYVALIEVIAVLGQNLSFRTDLNARESLISTATRRDSLFKLAKLVSYTPKRNAAANGLMKIIGVSTTDNVIDGNGTNLANTTVTWNDASNVNWYSQFVTVLNSTFNSGFAFGNPYDRQTINGVVTEQYRMNSVTGDVPVFAFSRNIGGNSYQFELVSTSISSGLIEEEAPLPSRAMAVVYKNDNRSSASSDTGFFIQFKQGSLGTNSFTISNPISNETVGINVPYINNSDVWLWQGNGTIDHSTLWTKVNDLLGSNIAYNSVNSNIRSVYSVSTRDRDQIDLNFSDGVFGDKPRGTFRLYYRQSSGNDLVITPVDMGTVVVSIPYYNSLGQPQTLSITLSLQYTVSNSAPTESNESIRTRAPQTYYLQNRIITAEDYSLAPATIGSDIIKSKSINRISSGVSKYYDIKDVTGAYSSTSLFGTDGVLYQNIGNKTFNFSYNNRTDLYQALKNQVLPILASGEMREFYYNAQHFPRQLLDTTFAMQYGVKWVTVNKLVNQVRGYFVYNNQPKLVGPYGIADNTRYITPEAMIKFVPPGQLPTNDPRYNARLKYFSESGRLIQTPTSRSSKYLWVYTMNVVGDGANGGLGALDDGTGPIVFNRTIDTGAVPVEILPKFTSTLSPDTETALLNNMINQLTFGIRYDTTTRQWSFITEANLDTSGSFSVANEGDNDRAYTDSSWLMSFIKQKDGYRVVYRSQETLFYSGTIDFYSDASDVIYDYRNSVLVKDLVTVLAYNYSATMPNGIDHSLGKDFYWQINRPVYMPNGYRDVRRVSVSGYERVSNGYCPDPDAFGALADTQWVVFNNGVAIDSLVVSYPSESSVQQADKIDGAYYVFTNTGAVKVYEQSTNTFVYQPSCQAFPGRHSVKFNYEHYASDERRIDPAKSNIIDVYLLTSEYDAAYRTWVNSYGTTEPYAPSTQQLENNYAHLMLKNRSISDEIVFNPVTYKLLFSSKSANEFKAKFLIVKSPRQLYSDNEIKASVIASINSFFSIDKWDFGQTFYFSELSRYVLERSNGTIANFMIEPTDGGSSSRLLEISCGANEIFVSGVTAQDIEIVSSLV